MKPTKSLKRKYLLHKNGSWKMVVIIGLVVAAGYLAYYWTQQSATIAEIREDVPSNCTSNLVSFMTTGSCGDNQVQRVDYTCSSSEQKYTAANNTDSNCLDPYSAFQTASAKCGMTCQNPVPTRSPLPTVTPTPKPSSSAPTRSPLPTVTPTPTPKPSSSAPTRSPIPPVTEGCYYQPVKCVKEPCEPQKICPSSSPAPSQIVVTPSLKPTPEPLVRSCYRQCRVGGQRWWSCFKECIFSLR